MRFYLWGAGLGALVAAIWLFQPGVMPTGDPPFIGGFVAGVLFGGASMGFVPGLVLDLIASVIRRKTPQVP